MNSSNAIRNWVAIRIYVKASDSPNPGYSEKAWGIFTKPDGPRWVSAFGKWNRQSMPSARGVVGRLNMIPLKDKHINADVKKITEKERKGYEHICSQRGFFINTSSGGVINLDYAPSWILEAIRERHESIDTTPETPSVHCRSSQSIFVDTFKQMDTAIKHDWF